MDIMSVLAHTDQPGAIYRALEAEVRDVLEATIITIMELDHDRGVARRSFTNMPDAYPTSGEKTVEPNAWVDQVLTRHEIFVANSFAEMDAVFPDAALIQSLGCESCLNLPIVVAGHVIGTLNCCAPAGHFTPKRVEAAKTLQTATALAILTAFKMKETT